MIIKFIAALGIVVAGALTLSSPTAIRPQDESAPRTAKPETARNHAISRQRPRHMSPELVYQVIEVAEDVDPVFAEQLESLRATGGDEAFGRSIRRARHLVGLARLRERNPQLYSVKVEELQVDAKISHTVEALREARRTGSELTATLEEELRTLVREQVSLTIAARGMYLQTLQEHIEAMRQTLEDKAANFNETVEERYRELMLDVVPE